MLLYFIDFVKWLSPCVSVVHCGYTSLHEHVIMKTFLFPVGENVFCGFWIQKSETPSSGEIITKSAPGANIKNTLFFCKVIKLC